MLKINKEAPKFELEAYHDGREVVVKLDDYKGKWVVLFFYPRDFTFICPTELGDMANNYDKFKEIGAEVLACSVDSVFVHKAWHDDSETIKAITFPMLADPTGNTCRNYGVLIEEEGVSLRSTFIIDPDGVVKSYEVNDNDIGRSADELIRKLQAAMFVRENGGEVCPANWHPGGQTLKPGLDLVGKI
ncbi:MAG: redoxin domain-containing protein [bacterium]|nr:redoxin domain-containing protein [bacterium]